MNQLQEIKEKHLMPIMGLIMAFCGLLITNFSYTTWSDDSRYQSFVPTSALIVDHVENKSSTGAPASHQYKFTYPDTTGNERTATIDSESGSLPAATFTNPNNSMGARFQIFLNPTNGQEWSLKHGPNFLTTLWLGAGMIMTLAGGFIFYPYLMRYFNLR